MNRNKNGSAKIWSLVLSAALVCTLTPTTVFAAENDGGISVGQSVISLTGQQAQRSGAHVKRTTELDFSYDGIITWVGNDAGGNPTTEDLDALETEGWKWEYETKTLTLNDFNFEMDISFFTGGNFFVPNGTTIKLAGTNSITNTSTSSSRALDGEGFTIENLDDSNPGVLNLKSSGSTVDGPLVSYGTLTIRGGIINADGGGAYGIMAWNGYEDAAGSLVISGGKLTSYGEDGGVYGNLSIPNGAVIRAGNNADDATVVTPDAIGGSPYVEITAGSSSPPRLDGDCVPECTAQQRQSHRHADPDV